MLFLDWADGNFQTFDPPEDTETINLCYYIAVGCNFQTFDPPEDTETFYIFSRLSGSANFQTFDPPEDTETCNQQKDNSTGE